MRIKYLEYNGCYKRKVSFSFLIILIKVCILKGSSRCTLCIWIMGRQEESKQANHGPQVGGTWNISLGSSDQPKQGFTVLPEPNR